MNRTMGGNRRRPRRLNDIPGPSMVPTLVPSSRRPHDSSASRPRGAGALGTSTPATLGTSETIRDLQFRTLSRNLRGVEEQLRQLQQQIEHRPLEPTEWERARLNPISASPSVVPRVAEEEEVNR